MSYLRVSLISFHFDLNAMENKVIIFGIRALCIMFNVYQSILIRMETEIRLVNVSFECHFESFRFSWNEIHINMLIFIDLNAF